MDVLSGRAALAAAAAAAPTARGFEPYANNGGYADVASLGARRPTHTDSPRTASSVCVCLCLFPCLCARARSVSVSVSVSVRARALCVCLSAPGSALSACVRRTIMAIAGDDFCVVAADTRQSNGYSINTRYAPKGFALCAVPFRACAERQREREEEGGGTRATHANARAYT
jgi:hypothetical protein